MKKYILISEEVIARLEEGKRVAGSLGRDELTGRLVFRAYQRRPQVRQRDRLLCQLEHGWLKESKERIKMYESVPKNLGRPYVGSVIEREAKTAKGALIDMELDMIEFC